MTIFGNLLAPHRDMKKKENNKIVKKNPELLSSQRSKLLPAKSDKPTAYPSPITISQDTFNLYLEDIRKVPLLTKEQELELGKKIKYGTPQERQGAVNQLVRANLRFVVSVALHYDREKKMITDLINEGNIGLIKAANKFDPDRKLKFISYAVWWIRQHILHYIISHQHLVTIPFNRAGRLRRVIKASQEAGYDIESSSAPLSEIAQDLDIEEDALKEAYQFAKRDISLDVMESGAYDTMMDSYPSPEEFYLKKAEIQEINRLMKNLTEREQYILKMYFGLGDNLPRSFEKIGKKLGISRERVRQIKERALQKMRQSPDSSKLRELTGN